jgi:hypothetical protein
MPVLPQLTHEQLTALPADVQALYVQTDTGFRLDLDTEQLELAAVAGLKAKNAELLGKLKNGQEGEIALQQQLNDQAAIVRDHAALMATMRQSLVDAELNRFVDKYVPESLRSIAAEKFAGFFDMEKGESGTYASKIGYTKPGKDGESDTFKATTHEQLWQHLRTEPALAGLIITNFAQGPSGAAGKAPAMQGMPGKQPSLRERAENLINSIE